MNFKSWYFERHMIPKKSKLGVQILLNVLSILENQFTHNLCTVGSNQFQHNFSCNVNFFNLQSTPQRYL
jgi:hypothetical protein